MANIREILKVKISNALADIENEIDRYSKLLPYDDDSTFNPLSDVYYEYMHFLNRLKLEIEDTLELLDINNEST